MHDIKWIRENPDAFDAALKRRGLAPLSGSLLAIDEKRRRVTLKTQCLNGDKVVVDGEATVLVPRRDAA